MTNELQGDAAGERAWVWAEIDLRTPIHRSPGGPSSPEEALDLLRRCTIEPTMVVTLGSCIQAWWRLSSEPTREVWVDLMARVAHAVGSVHSNVNRPMNPSRSARLLSCSGKEVSVEALLGFSLPPNAVVAAWEGQLLRTARGTVKSTVGNVMIVLRNAPEFRSKIRYNEMTQSPELDGTRLTQPDITRLRGVFEDKYGMTPGAQTMWEALTAVSSESAYHPVRAYLSGLRWDGEPRIHRVLTEILGSAETELSQRIVRAWFIAAVARAMEPGSKVDSALVLVGPQGFGKSSFFRALGKPWFSDTPIDVTRKDAYLQIAGAWIYECQEIESFAASERRSQVKAFMTSQADSFRKPYEHATAELKRWCVLVGTTNEEHFLADPTGARRYWPLRVTRLIDIERLQALRDSLWAEAVAAYRTEESWWLSQADERALAELAESFRSHDPWEEPVTLHLQKVRPDALLTTRSILTAIEIPAHMQTVKAGHRISQIMQRLGYRTIRKRTEGGGVPRVWIKQHSS